MGALSGVLFGNGVEGSSYKGKIVVPGHGQSNIGNWSSPTYSEAGKTAIEGRLSSNFPNAQKAVYISAAEGGSYVSKRVHDAQLAGTNEYWVDDTDADSANWAVGPEMTNALTDITNAGYTAAEVTHAILGIGESDAAGIRDGDITEAHYKLVWEWWLDYMRGQYTSLRSFGIQMIGKNTSDKLGGYQSVRNVELSLIAENADVQFASTLYDQTLSDSVHYDNAGYTAAGTRAGNWVCLETNVATFPTVGPKVSSESLSGKTLTLDILHDYGNSLTGAKASSGDQMFRVFQGSLEFDIDTITVNDADISIALVDYPVGSLSIYYPYDAVHGVTDTGAYIKDNSSSTLPLQDYAGTVTLTDEEIEEALNTLPNLIARFNVDHPENYNASATSGQDAWTNLVEGGNNAYLDGSDVLPTYSDDALGTGFGGLVSDGTLNTRLLLQHSLTTSSDATAIVVFTPEVGGTDPEGGSSLNSVLTTGGATTGESLISIGQERDTPGNLRFGGKGSGSSYDGNTFNQQPHILTVAVDSTNFYGRYDGTADGSDGSAHTSTAQIDETNGDDTGTPLLALFNDVDRPTGSGVRACLGAIHEVFVFSAKISDTQLQAIEQYLIAKYAAITTGFGSGFDEGFG